MIHYVDVSIQYDRDRIFRRLKISPGSPVHDYAVSAFPKLEELVQTKLHMVHCYCVEPHTQPVGVPDVDCCSHMVTCLSSCTSEIMDTIGGLLEGGDYLEGYILNDFVNEILFNASDQMNRQIAAAVRRQDCRLSRRFSPGEEEMGLEQQARLIRAFQSEPSLSYLHLTESYMLYPEKSMLYVFGADPKNPEISIEHDCAKCPNKNCFFRMESTATACY